VQRRVRHEYILTIAV